MTFLEKLPQSGRTTALAFVVLSLGPLALLTFSSMTLADDAVRREVVARVQTTSEMSSSLVQLEMQSVAELVQAYATRPRLVDAVGTGDPDTHNKSAVTFQVGELLSSRPGMRGAFLTDTSCTVWSIRPAAPQVIGQSFAYRDWCAGVGTTGAPYVSEAYQTAVQGNPLVITAVAPVRARDDDGTGEPLAYLAVLYDLNEIQRFVTELEEAQGIALTIVDQRGTELGRPSAAGASESELYERRADPLLTEAFAGLASATETTIDGEDVLVATSPVADLGWVVMAQVPAKEAFAGVSALRSTVLRVAGILALVLIAGAWFIFRILRQRKVAEAAMRATETRTRGILDTASDGFVAMGDDGRVTDWNAAAAELFGWTSHEAIGQHLAELIVPPEQRETLTQDLKRFLRTGDGDVLNQRVEVEVVDRAGTTVLVEFSITVVQANDSWTFNAFVHDISDRKRHELELAEARDEALVASQLKSDFLANMSHEIRTPMNGVIGMTSLLLDTDLDPSQRDDAETVLRSGESLLAIIDDILDFSKIEAGRLDLESIEFGTQDLIEDVTSLLSVRAAEKGVELVVYVDPEVPAHVKGDPGRIRQVLTNLLGNALKFTGSGEVVLEVGVDAQHPTSTTASPERTLRFDVTDTGIGIGIEQQKTIFHTFTQADSSTTRRYGGTGLGLAISQQLVTLMSGEIGVDSALGTGSTFWFTLPVTVAEPLERRARRDDLTGTRILVVDDNATNRKMLGRTLESWGVEHREAPDGPAALHLLRDAAANGYPFDAALVDFHMPGVDGLTLASQIVADSSIESVALILLTSSAQRGEAGLAEAAGMAGYLEKPVHRSQLYACLATVLGNGDLATGQVPIVTRHRLTEMAARGGTVLLAEDNPINQRVACGMLHALGYQVDVVSNGREAVAAAASTTFDAILMDCQMPEMDGYEATQLIRAAEGATRRTPIVAVTASAMEQDRQRCLDAGMDEHLAKPLRRDQLAVTLEALAHGRQPVSDANGSEGLNHGYAPVGDLQTSIQSRLDELFEGLDLDIDAESTKLIESFLRRAADEIDHLNNSLAANDAHLVCQHAHSLKGMASNVGVTTVATCAAEVEDAARDERLHAIGPAVNDLRVALEAAERIIQTMLPSLAARA